MCTTCGCASGETRIEGVAIQKEGQTDPHWHVHADGTSHSHSPVGEAHVHQHQHQDGTIHSHIHDHQGPHHHGHAGGARHLHENDAHHYGRGLAGAHAPGLTQARMVQIERDILSKNDALAAENRQYFHDRGILALNLVSSPGSGKTTLLCRTLLELQSGTHGPLVVIEGDQQTSFDAERIRATGVRALQINTGKGCHLDAHMVGQAVHSLNLADDTLLFIENVGNLVCPAAFDLGEAHKVAILSATEGEDKPLKYPDMFHAASLMIINKVDLLPYVQFNVARAVELAQRINPNLEVIELSATTGEGMQDWLDWLTRQSERAQARRRESVHMLKQRIAELESEVHSLQHRLGLPHDHAQNNDRYLPPSPLSPVTLPHHHTHD